MKEAYKEALIQAVVEQVLKAISVPEKESLSEEGMDRLLVIGDIKKVPETFGRDYKAESIDDYISFKNIRRYKKVLITELSLTQLSDIALGRDGAPESCAVVYALLSGIDVALLENALPHRRFAGRGSAGLYAVIEKNVNALQTYGVKLLKEEKPVIVKEARPPKYAVRETAAPKGSLKPNISRLITEERAISLIKDCGGAVEIPADAIVTPSAWDIFDRHKIKVIRQ